MREPARAAQSAALARIPDVDKRLREADQARCKRTQCRRLARADRRRPSELLLRVWSRNRPPQQRAHFFLNIDDDFRFAQLFDEAGVFAAQLVGLILQRMALGLWTAFLRRQGFQDTGLALTPPGRQQRRVQSFTPEQDADAARSFGRVGFVQDALLVPGRKTAALGVSDHFWVGVQLVGLVRVRLGLGIGADFGGGGTSVALASLALPASRRRQSRWRTSGNL